MNLLAVDPGHAKCGLALLAGDVRRLEVIERGTLSDVVRQWSQQFSVERVLVGGATGSRPVVQELQGLGLPVTVVDEFRTSERARQRYWKDHPPRGLWKLVPLGLQVPPVPIDDYAALVMAEDFLATKGV